MEFEVAQDTHSQKPDAVKYTREQEGVNEDMTRSEAALAVQSIPFYVEVSSIFLALVPEIKHKDTGRFCNYASWFCRGWCRHGLQKSD